ncbi:hypothetical protein D3C72_1797320 [compost metagenome]
MRVAGACPPDIGLGVARLGANLGIGLASRQANHVDLDPAFLLEIGGHLLANDDVCRANQIETACRLRLRRREC